MNVVAGSMKFVKFVALFAAQEYCPQFLGGKLQSRPFDAAITKRRQSKCRRMALYLEACKVVYGCSM